MLRRKKPDVRVNEVAVVTREVPQRSLLGLRRKVHDSRKEALVLGREFNGIRQAQQIPAMDGRAGARFCVFWGLTRDSIPRRGGLVIDDIEWCFAVADDQAEALAAKTPELVLRAEPAHREAFFELGPGNPFGPMSSFAAHSLGKWADEHGPQPSELAARLTFFHNGPATECDFALPFS